MSRKANPIDVKIKITNLRDWKKSNQLDIKVEGLFRNSGWRVESITHKASGDLVQIDIKTKHLGGLSAMVLTPFEVVEKVQIKPRDNYKVRVVVDGDECATQVL